MVDEGNLRDARRLSPPRPASWSSRWSKIRGGRCEASLPLRIAETSSVVPPVSPSSFAQHCASGACLLSVYDVNDRFEEALRFRFCCTKRNVMPDEAPLQTAFEIKIQFGIERFQLRKSPPGIVQNKPGSTALEV